MPLVLKRNTYLIGETFAQRYGGTWYVEEDQKSRYFARYIVGQFHKLNPSAVMFDPFDVAVQYINDPPGRSLFKYINQIDWELRNPVL